MRSSALGAVSLAVALSSGCAEREGPPFEPAVDVKDLMIAIVDPAADVLWDAVGTVISEDGIDEWQPTTDEEWANVRNAAVVIMESGNLLMMEGRARDQGAWMDLSSAMIDAGREALAAAESRNPDEVFAVGEAIYNACDRCHGLYWIGDEDRGRIRETPKSHGASDGGTE